METITLSKKLSSEVINIASDAINHGKIVLCPFDTVYGLVCDPKNELVIKGLIELKGRDQTKVIGMAASSVKMISFVAALNHDQIKYIEKITPGAYTFLVKARNDLDISILCQKDGTIGIRIPDSQMIIDLIAAFGRPIAQTSANKSGHPNCYNVQEFFNQFDNAPDIDLVIDGGTLEERAPSQLIDLTKEKPKIIERG